ncbi:Hpt domain-containing protein [Magnetospirillum gryphiswaldense]|uniref:Hpt domain-containing protein n=1 Tax=Magnetospirillum gryphiswaldense TaxID=55518 RepID=UPI000D0376FF|nr:Hpt domain-containing protein [Magnetospirillum gryphiswaldense]
MTAWRDAPLLDAGVIAQLQADLEADELAEILAAFAADIHSRADQLAAALAAGDTGLAHRAAHSLKGAALNLGRQRLGLICAHFQHAGQADIKALWPEFAAICDAVLAAQGQTGLAFEVDSSIVRA